MLSLLLLAAAGCDCRKVSTPEAGGGAVPVRRLPLRVPSGGLAWSQARYPGQYRPANLATNRMQGLDARANERFLDVANRAYSREFTAGFSYTDPALAQPSVTVIHCRRAETFAGRIVARGLKPHFAYQLKLSADGAADPAAFDALGRIGRRLQPGSRRTNFSDAEYEAYADKSGFESYLFFDFFVTDDQGRADKPFYLDSSLHVLFNQPHQGSPRPVDSRPVLVTFTNTDSRIYANPRPSVAPHYLYAQTEAGANGQIRPDIGEAFPEPGPYRARLVLVEESFHGYGDGGYWPTVMACDVAFEVLPQPLPPPPLWQAVQPGRQAVSFDRFRSRYARVLSVEPSACSFVSDGTGWYPRLEMTNAVPLPPGHRQIVAFDIRTEQAQELFVYASADRRFDDGDKYRIRVPGHPGWQRIEQEIAFEHKPARVFLAIYGPLKGAPVVLADLQLVTPVDKP